MAKVNMFRVYVVKLIFRLSVLGFVMVGYFARPDFFELFFKEKVYGEVGLVVVVWAIFMGSMIFHMLPNAHITMGSQKLFQINYQPVVDYNRQELLEKVRKDNVSALWVLVAWLFLAAILGILFLQGIIGEKELILLTAVFYVSDLVCVLFWCPFQQFFIHNKCCVGCRIFNWGHFMMFTPLLFIVNFFTWSLFFTSLIVMLSWEITMLKYPERLWEGSNQALQCAHCQDHICHIKPPKYFEKHSNVSEKRKGERGNEREW
jgi:hypothetical protein